MITAIVVSRGLEVLLVQCLRCLETAAETAGEQVQAVVVDNGSVPPYLGRDIAPSRLPVRLLRFDRRISFAHANNTAATRVPADRYLLLNNDVLLHPKALLAMVELQERTEAGICGSRLLFPDGTIQHCGVVFGPGRIGPYHVHRGRQGHLVPRYNEEFQAVSGACMLVVGEVWRILGGLDEGYPFGLEDIDLCLRARRAGFRVVCAQEVDSLHFEAMTEGRVELDVPSRRLFMNRWQGRYGVEG